MEEKNEQGLMVVDDNNSFVADLTVAAKTMFCSVIAETQEEKAALFTNMNSPARRLKDEINLEIKAKHLYCELVRVVNKDTGDLQTCPRTVIIDENNVGHQCVSWGIFNSIKKLIAIYGTPEWNPPVPVVVKQISKGVYNVLTLEGAPAAGNKK